MITACTIFTQKEDLSLLSPGDGEALDFKIPTEEEGIEE